MHGFSACRSEPRRLGPTSPEDGLPPAALEGEVDWSKGILGGMGAREAVEHFRKMVSRTKQVLAPFCLILGGMGVREAVEHFQKMKAFLEIGELSKFSAAACLMLGGLDAGNDVEHSWQGGQGCKVGKKAFIQSA
eukprot:1156797-Pelagomonas_calceolata.AAC.5